MTSAPLDHDKPDCIPIMNDDQLASLAETRDRLLSTLRNIYFCAGDSVRAVLGRDAEEWVTRVEAFPKVYREYLGEFLPRVPQLELACGVKNFCAAGVSGLTAHEALAKATERDLDILRAFTGNGDDLTVTPASREAIRNALAALPGFTRADWVRLVGELELEWRLLCDAAPPAVRRDNKTEARDAWIYRQAVKGVAYSVVRSELKRKTNGWGKLSSDNGVKAAAMRYAKRHNLQLPAPRKASRPTT